MKIGRILLIFGISGIIFCGILGLLAIWGSLDRDIVTKTFFTYFFILSALTSRSRVDKWAEAEHKIPVLKEFSYFIYLISIIIFSGIGIGLIWGMLLFEDDFLRKILSSIGLIDFILFLSNSIINRWAHSEDKSIVNLQIIPPQIPNSEDKPIQ